MKRIITIAATAVVLAGGLTATAEAAVHGYSVAFWWSALIFLVAAVVCGAVMTSKLPENEPDLPRVAV